MHRWGKLEISKHNHDNHNETKWNWKVNSGSVISTVSWMVNEPVYRDSTQPYTGTNPLPSSGQNFSCRFCRGFKFLTVHKITHNLRSESSHALGIFIVCSLTYFICFPCEKTMIGWHIYLKERNHLRTQSCIQYTTTRAYIFTHCVHRLVFLTLLCKLQLLPHAHARHSWPAQNNFPTEATRQFTRLKNHKIKRATSRKYKQYIKYTLMLLLIHFSTYLIVFFSHF